MRSLLLTLDSTATAEPHHGDQIVVVPTICTAGMNRRNFVYRESH